MITDVARSDGSDRSGESACVVFQGGRRLPFSDVRAGRTFACADFVRGWRGGCAAPATTLGDLPNPAGSGLGIHELMRAQWQLREALRWPGRAPRSVSSLAIAPTGRSQRPLSPSG